ncbi:helix-turn-helix domain-containing protein [Bacillus sp. CMF21]|uniref:helix-turn-helix domain-containing protein n=1 Tax=Metabacillus dongyingensis TaxID=2874282 RepID=UPI001CBA79FE|nr:helix-turn-helix transcriptional regulator [Metabacillus dongyingensis]UAL52661.1 helix-turn-helix domain-containing protein [Metabacillus dongyingensis]UOK58322.1 helix-turn-helix domain-containing protein [Bacillus sp. OVS6]USK28978.1 helix-turn-helix domain-containing protein [Bacillus sp. CMF21]
MILNRLTTLRKGKRWSLQYTADRLGIAKSTYAGYESGHRRPSLEALKSMADLFDVSTDYLLGRVDHPTFQLEEDTIKSVQFMELTDLPNLELAVDGIFLSVEEMHQFIAFIRAKRELEGKAP